MSDPIITVELAAIQGKDGKIYSLPRPGRHNDVIDLMRKAGITGPIPQASQGFLLSDGQFVDRITAAKIALANGQIRKLPRSIGLFTQDLWRGGFQNMELYLKYKGLVLED